MFGSLLIANRGEIARRIIRTARRMGLRTVAVATEADRSWPHWREADDAVFIGEGPVGESYLSIERLLEAARATGAQAVHPGYGFLSENARFAEACEAAGIVFVGPPPSAIRVMGSKAEAKALMQKAGVPVVPGYHGERQEPDFLKQKAYETGYPVLVKAVAGGGGRGMRRVDRAIDFEAALVAARREALSAFGDDRVLIERYVANPRHIEVQVFADSHGRTLHLFERDCSVQRRHQKVIEEAPSPGMTEEARAAMTDAAIRAAEAVGYRGAGTVEFIADASRGLRPDAFFFMEMNTRLQVEHPVTEAVTGIDLVEWQLRVAAGERLPLTQGEIPLQGHAIEARLYAEDPAANFAPSTGRLLVARFPEGGNLRIDAGVEDGSTVTPFYDSMLAKAIASGGTREAARRILVEALARVRVGGPRTNIAFLAAVLEHPDFAAGGVDTGFIDRNLDALTRRPVADLKLAAAAAAEHLAGEAERWAVGAPGPWARTDAFEIGAIGRRTGLAVEVEGEPLEAEIRWSREGWALSLDERAPPARESGWPDILWADHTAVLFSRGDQMRIDIPDPLERDVAGAAATGHVRAPISGRVVAILVAAGERVEEGRPLFTLEAMKMEHAVSAPAEGRVADVLVEAGRQVEEGAELLRLEPAEEGDGPGGPREPA
jgi:3-methylcrotonyl-CoA carboxylase alpha subunit